MRQLCALLVLLMAWLPLAQAGSWCCLAPADSTPQLAEAAESDAPCHPTADSALPLPASEPHQCDGQCPGMAQQGAALPEIDGLQVLAAHESLARPGASPTLAGHVRPLLRPPTAPLR